MTPSFVGQRAEWKPEAPTKFPCSPASLLLQVSIIPKQAKSWGRFSTCPPVDEVFVSSFRNRNQSPFPTGQVKNLPHDTRLRWFEE